MSDIWKDREMAKLQEDRWELLPFVVPSILDHLYSLAIETFLPTIWEGIPRINESTYFLRSNQQYLWLHHETNPNFGAHHGCVILLLNYARGNWSKTASIAPDIISSSIKQILPKICPVMKKQVDKIMWQAKKAEAKKSKKK